jgi:hypothetical protein
MGSVKARHPGTLASCLFDTIGTSGFFISAKIEAQTSSTLCLLCLAYSGVRRKTANLVVAMKSIKIIAA